MDIMLRSMVMVLTRLAPMEDRYHVGHKRYNASGALYVDLFSKLLKQYLKSVRLKIQRLSSVPSDEGIKQVILSAKHLITNQLCFTFFTGNGFISKVVVKLCSRICRIGLTFLI